MTKTNTPAFVVALALLFLLGAQAPRASAATGPVVARVAGVEIGAGEAGLTVDAGGKASLPDSAVARERSLRTLQFLCMRVIATEYVREHKLLATDAEIRECSDSLRGEVRTQVADANRMKAVLTEKRKARGITAAERKKIDEQLAAIKRFVKAATAKEKQRKAKGLSPQEIEYARHAVESRKFQQAIYAQYGGVVADTKFGPDLIGARKGIMEEWEKSGRLTIPDSTIRNALFAWLAMPPQRVIPKDKVVIPAPWKTR